MNLIEETNSIIAIHGLNGHRENTWTAENCTLWLKDLLPKRLPAARIITYGYDTRTYSGQSELSTQTLTGHGQEFLRDLCSFREVTEVCDSQDPR